MVSATVDPSNALKVLCSVCCNPAVRKRIFCGDCGVWSHPSCYEKKKCCDAGNGDTIIKDNKTIYDDDSELNQSIIHESVLWETSIVKDTTNEQKRSIDELCNVIKELFTRNRTLEEQLIQQKKDELVKATKFKTFIQTELRVLQKNTEILMTEIISIKNHLADHTVAKTEDTITSASKNDNTLKNWEFPLKPMAERSTQNKTGKFHCKRTSDSNAIILDNDIDNEIRNMISQNNLTTLTSVSSSINATSLLPKEDKSTNFKTDDVPKQKKNRQPKATVKDNDFNQNVINTAGEENFQIVEKKKRKRNKISVGENMDESDFVGAKRKIWLFYQESEMM
ncbi:hypothetical protein Zmor_021878 [Zophobas morio]|uniref:Uncharacterized protein n=1 Tax=Zophobas morio TaxID=2755281 RepID=A0AA38I9Y3_9CUCU|nr:hypothetical protein Zmor_021878 [Zophobas morio]